MTKDNAPRNWRKRHPILTGFIILCAIIFIGGKAFYYAAETHFYRGMIPAKIETDGRYYIGAKKFQLFDLIRGESCGIAIFHLSEKTIEQVNSQGLPFFADARKGVGERWLGKEDAISEYEKWQATPLPQKVLSDGLPPSFSAFCSGPKRELNLSILAAFKQFGSFYTVNQRHSGLYVIPELKIVIFTFYD